MTDEQTPTEEPKLVILSGREYPELVKAMQLRQAAFIIRDFITWMKVQKGNEIQLKTDDGAQVPLQVFIPEEDKIPIEQHTPLGFKDALDDFLCEFYRLDQERLMQQQEAVFAFTRNDERPINAN